MKSNYKINKRDLNSLLLLKKQICFPFYAASRLITQAYQPFLDKMGITYPQYFVLMVLWEKDRQSVKQIGELLLLDSGTLTPIMQKLYTRGFIKRTRDPADQRIVYNQLTSKGKKLKSKAVQMSIRLFCNSGLKKSQAEKLRTTVNEFLTQLQSAQ